MKYLVSACLLGHNCKYSGGNNYSADLAEILQGHEVIAVCPEVLGGLPIPRAASEIVGKIVMNSEGTCVDKEFRRGAEAALQIALDNHVNAAILQSRSPSCGVKEIYDGSFSRKLIPGMGIFARMLKKAGIPMIDLEDIDNLRAK